MSYDEKLVRLASTLPVNFDGIEVARVAEAHKHHDAGVWVDKTAWNLLNTREDHGDDFNSALDAIGEPNHNRIVVQLSALRDAIRLLARQRMGSGQLQPA